MIDKFEEKVEVKETALPEGAYVIKNHDSETVTLSSSPVSAKFAQLFIQNVKNSVISLLFLSGSVRIENCDHSQVFLGPCQTSVYLESCHHCTIYAASHQLRIHNCTHVTLYVLCQSHPIIEDCQHMIFAPYPLTPLQPEPEYLTLQEDLVKANLREAVGNNKWREVVDFNWHKVEPSPNWSILVIKEQSINNEKEEVPVEEKEFRPRAESFYFKYSMLMSHDQPQVRIQICRTDRYECYQSVLYSIMPNPKDESYYLDNAEDDDEDYVPACKNFDEIMIKTCYKKNRGDLPPTFTCFSRGAEYTLTIVEKVGKGV